jgi:hypothetical protein
VAIAPRDRDERANERPELADVVEDDELAERAEDSEAEDVP